MIEKQTIAIDLSSRYLAAFGLLFAGQLPSKANLSQDEKGFELTSFDAVDPDFENIKFIYSGSEINFAALPFVSTPDEPIANILAPPPIISFSRQKADIETPTNENDNIVVEHWGTRPWEIRMRGLLIDVENHHYPEQRINQLYQLFEYNGVVEVSGTQFFDKDIASIYFKGIEITGIQGYQDTVQYSLQARSIRPVEFTLLNP